MTKADTPFLLEALVDFPDDVLTAGRALTAADLDALMATLAGLGIRRVSWGYYGDGHGGWLNPTGFSEDYDGGWAHYDATYRGLGNPLKAAVAAGHRHGLEVYAYFKPYETGAALNIPAGSPLAKAWGRLPILGGTLGWMDPFVAAHPELRIQHRGGLPAGTDTAEVCALRLTKRDAAPTRVTREHLQLWSSPDNWHYQPLDIDFQVTETVEPAPRDARDNGGRLVMRRGEPVRMLTLSGFRLADRHLLVTTDFTDGPADFLNAGTALLTALDAEGREIPGVFANGWTCWCGSLVDFRHGGLTFDFGWGMGETALDAPNANGKQGLIAFARGRNAYLPGALCETEPAVQRWWLDCLEEMIDAGVDGVDIREENHSTHTDTPEEYGYNPVVLAQCGDLTGEALRRKIAEVRGDAYTAFLAACKARLAAAGKRLRYNLQVDFFRPDPVPARLLAYPANLDFQWRRWLDEGLLDEAILRTYSLPDYCTPLATVLEDAVVREMLDHCARRKVPVTVNRYIQAPGDKLPDELCMVREDGRFRGFIFYEVDAYIDYGAEEGGCMLSYPLVGEAAKGAR
jgi:hypothetical protein